MSYTYEYPRPALTVDAVVFRNNSGTREVLLIQRKHYPHEGMWALPGGFINMDETCEDAMIRELKEETDLDLCEFKQMHTFSSVDRDPRGRTVSVTFFGTAEFSNSKVKGGDDASEARWFDLKKLPSLAFDHSEVLVMACEKFAV